MCERIPLQYRASIDELDTEFQAKQLTIEPIGNRDVHLEGRDQYVMVVRKADHLHLDDARNWLLSRVCRNSNTPGGYYCTKVRAIDEGFEKSEVLCIIEHRYDV